MRSQQLREPFLMIPDRLITEGNPTHLTQIELYVYSLLLKKRNYEGITETSITFMYETLPFELVSSKQRSIDLIKKTLQSLADKKVIRICNSKKEGLKIVRIITPEGEIIDEYKYKPTDLIIIIFGNSTIKGHTEVDYSEFDSFTSISDYYIYVATARFKNSGNGSFNCSYERWAKILGIKERHARTKVNDAVEKEIIYKNIGNYQDDDSIAGTQKRQEKNSYRITEYKQHEKTIMTKRNEAKSRVVISDNVAELF